MMQVTNQLSFLNLQFDCFATKQAQTLYNGALVRKAYH